MSDNMNLILKGLNPSDRLSHNDSLRRALVEQAEHAPSDEEVRPTGRFRNTRLLRLLAARARHSR